MGRGPRGMSSKWGRAARARKGWGLRLLLVLSFVSLALPHFRSREPLLRIGAHLQAGDLGSTPSRAVPPLLDFLHPSTTHLSNGGGCAGPSCVSPMCAHMCPREPPGSPRRGKV